MKRKYRHLFYILILSLILIGKSYVEINPISKALSSEGYSNNFFSSSKTHIRSNKIISEKTFRTSLEVKNFSEMSFDEQFCYMKSAYPDLKFNENSLFQFRSELDENEKIDTVFYINEDRCPNESYSIIKFDQNGSIKKILDCESVSKTDLFLESQTTQYNIHSSDLNNEFVHNYAINGSGHFLMYCPQNQKYYVTRNGEFEYTNGGLMNQDGCFLTSTDHHFIFLKINEKMDNTGCFPKNNLCAGFVNLKKFNAKDFKFLNRDYTEFKYSKQEKNTYRLDKLSQVFDEALEDRNPKYVLDTGLSEWSEADTYRPPTNCTN